MQNNYINELATAVAGMIGHQEEGQVLTSRQVSGAVIPPGRAVKRGASAGLVASCAAQADVFLGVAVIDHSARGTVTANPNSEFAVGEDIPVLLKGDVWVVADAAIAVGALAYFAQASNRFTSVVGTNCPVPNGRFETAAAAPGDLVLLRLS
jgi:Uncharacterized conserved protein (DUF2190)